MIEKTKDKKYFSLYLFFILRGISNPDTCLECYWGECLWVVIFEKLGVYMLRKKVSSLFSCLFLFFFFIGWNFTAQGI